MLIVDTKNIKRFSRDLLTFNNKLIGKVTRDTLNTAAFTAQKFSRNNVDRDMVVRNKWATRSIQVDMTRRVRINQQETRTGSLAEYMKDQEFGTTIGKKGKVGHPIATSVASGEGRGARPRKKVPTRANRLPNIVLGKKRTRGFKSKRQEIFVRVLLAAKKKEKRIYLDTGDTKAIYKISGRITRTKKGKVRNGVKMNMIYNLSRKSVMIPPIAWLEPATERTRSMMPRIYEDKLKAHLRKGGIFKGLKM